MSKMVQIRHVPDSLHKQLRAKALGADMTLSDYLLREITVLAQLRTPDEAFSALHQREPIAPSRKLTSLIRKARDDRR
jgi:antitoxin FitA